MVKSVETAKQALVDEVFHKRLVDAGMDKLLENEFEFINK